MNRILLPRSNKLINLLLKSVLIFISFVLIGCSTSKLPSSCNSNCNKLPDSLNSILFVFAHQDDEVFIVTRLLDHIQRNDSIYCIWISRSEFKGEKYAQKRISESKYAMELIGVPSANLHFLNLPDGETYNHLPKIISNLKTIIKEINPKIIYLPAYEMGHIDHDITNFTTVQSVKELKLNVEIYEFPLYNVVNTNKLIPFKVRQLPDSINTCCRILSKEEFNTVLSFWSLYPSQYFPLDPFIRCTVGYRKAFGIEYYRKIPKYNYLKKPFEANAAYERFLFGPTYKDFHEAVEEYINQK